MKQQITQVVHAEIEGADIRKLVVLTDTGAIYMIEAQKGEKGHSFEQSDWKEIKLPQFPGDVLLEKKKRK